MRSAIGYAQAPGISDVPTSMYENPAARAFPLDLYAFLFGQRGTLVITNSWARDLAQISLSAFRWVACTGGLRHANIARTLVRPAGNPTPIAASASRVSADKEYKQLRTAQYQLQEFALGVSVSVMMRTSLFLEVIAPSGAKR